MDKGTFWKTWDLQLLRQIKINETVVSEVEFAVPKDAHDTVWDLFERSELDIDHVCKVADEFDCYGDDPTLCIRLKRKMIKKTFERKEEKID